MDIISNITIISGSDHYSILWIIFSIMIGIALAVDFGLYNNIKSLIKRKQGSSQAANIQACAHMDNYLDFSCNNICWNNICYSWT